MTTLGSQCSWWRHQTEAFSALLDWPVVRGIHQSPVNSSHKGQWHGALMFSLICAWKNGWVNNREAGDFRRHLAHYDVTVMLGFCAIHDPTYPHTPSPHKKWPPFRRQYFHMHFHKRFKCFISIRISLKFIPKGPRENTPSWVQVTIWRRTGDQLYMNQCCPLSLTRICATGGTWVNTLRPRRNEQHFADDIFKRIFFNENVWISIKISLKFVPKGPINNIPALVQIMAWRRWGDKPLSEPMMVSLPTHICVTRPQWVKCFTFTLRVVP